MKEIDKGMEIVKDKKGKKVIRDKMDIGFEDQEEAERIDKLTEERMGQTLKAAKDAAKKR